MAGLVTGLDPLWDQDRSTALRRFMVGPRSLHRRLYIGLPRYTEARQWLRRRRLPLYIGLPRSIPRRQQVAIAQPRRRWAQAPARHPLAEAVPFAAYPPPECDPSRRAC